MIFELKLPESSEAETTQETWQASDTDYLKDVCTAPIDGLAAPTPYPDDAPTPCTALRGSKRHPRGIPSDGFGNESDDAYPAVLFQVANRWRAIVCRDGIQYILQYRTSPTQPCRWRGKSYPSTREGLRESIQRLVGPYACEAVKTKIDALPEHVSAWELPAEGGKPPSLSS